MTTQQNTLNPVDPIGILPPAGPAGEPTRLKAERVQLRVEPPSRRRSRALRLEAWLACQSGWRPARDGNGIVRERRFPTALAAARYAAYLAQSATVAAQRVDIRLAGTRVTIVVRGNSQPTLSKSALDFAESCG